MRGRGHGPGTALSRDALGRKARHGMSYRALRQLLLALLMVTLFVTTRGTSAGISWAEDDPLPVQTETSGQYTGVWVGHYLFSRIELHVEHSGERFCGVAYIFSPLSSKNTYHFTGTVRNGHIVASHFRGHVFVGELVSPDSFEGVLTTAKKDHRLNITARRVEPASVAGTSSSRLP